MARLHRAVKVFAVAWIGIVWLAFSPNAATVRANVDYGVYVQDEAGVLSAQTRQELYNRAIWLHEQTGTAQVGVVAVKDLEGRTLEDYAVSRFRKLGLGDRKKNDGVLLLYEDAGRHVRIEVGYGLEGRITDGKAGAILDTYFVPNRDSGQLDLAFSQTQSAIVSEVAAEYGIDASGVTDRGLPPLEDGTGGSWFAAMPGYAKLILGVGIVFLIFLDFKFTGGAITFFVLNLIGRRGGSGGGRTGGRGGGGSSGGGGASR
ncbi:TPM domain-containing protein [Cohnella endophytica]|uniref:TPM domain-containing protein n=1 Tax=Cohnella endophytica TaxID=2419778 RepID=A0A494XQZ1_9BACL|nr:TPM domain-containing protein [Cohnella endophytica]RKP53050.1 TPM domain-containing protein [Cohnella endophytica]